MIRTLLTNMGTLSLFKLRLARTYILIWILALSIITLIMPNTFDSLYGTPQERAELGGMLQNPGITAMVGPGKWDTYTIGALLTHQMLLFSAIAISMMSILLVNRYTRAEEEDGRFELIRSLPVGRLADVNATFLVLCGTNVIIALVTGLGLSMFKLNGISVEGSLLYGATLGSIGILFSTMTLLFSQLVASSRGTIVFSTAALVMMYLFRAIGDVSNDIFTMLSPLGWVTATQAYGENNWWPVIALLGVAILCLALTNILHQYRDMDAGLLPERQSKAYANILLQTLPGHVIRLQRMTWIAWGIGLFMLGISYGSIFGDIEGFFADNEMLQQFIDVKKGFTYAEQFLPMLMLVMGMVAAIPTLLTLLSLHSEERKGRIEPILTRVISRQKLFLTYVFLSIVIGFIMISLPAIGLWISANAVMEDGVAFTIIYQSAVIYYPALLVMIGLAALLLGVFPKWKSFIWLYVFYTFFVLYLGGLFDFPNWIEQVTPYGYIPQFPVDEIALLPLTLLSIIAVILIGVGGVGYRKRDIM